MKRKLLGLVILVLLLFVPLMAHAATAGKFTSVEGNVDVTSPGREARPANPGDLLNIGDIIRTKSKSKCEVAFLDGSILRLGENSRLRVNEFAQEKGGRNATLELFRGKIQNVVTAVTGSASGQSKYEIQTATAVCGVRGTDFFVYHQAGVTGAAFREGTGYGYSRNRPQDVRPIQAGQAMTVSSPNVPPVVRPASASEMNQHRKDTAPSEKPKSEAKKEEEKKPEGLAAKTDEGKKEEQKKEEQKKEEQKDEQKKEEGQKKEEQKSGESKPADEGKKEEQKKEEQKTGEAKPAGKTTETGKEEEKKSESVTARTDEGKKEEQKTGEPKPAEKPSEGAKPPEKRSEEPQKTSEAAPGSRENGASGQAAAGNQPKAEEPQKIVEAAAPAASREQSRPVEIVSTLQSDAPQKIVEAAAPAAFREQSGFVDIVARTTEAATSGALSLPPVATTPSQTILSAPSVIPTTTIDLISGSSGLGDAIVVPVADAVPPKITRLVPDNFSDDTRITNQSGATFTVEFNENATISYSLDGSNYVSAAGDKLILTGLPEGSNTVFVKGIDPAGNVSSATSYSWKTDYTAPTITLSGTPASVTNVNSANIGVVATDANAVTTAYRLDGVAVSSPILTGLAAGSHTFAVTATDAAGNIATKEYAWKTDYTAPVITVTPQVVPAATGKAGIKVSLAGNETVAFSSLLDGTTSLAGASLDLKDLAPGAHKIDVSATDEAGNASSQSISFNLERYPLSGKFSDSGGNASGLATGELANISGQSWGGWNLDMSGSGNATPSASWILSAGGKNADGSYWLDIAPGTTESAAKTLTGKSQLTYLSRDSLGVGTGTVAGKFDGLGSYTLSDAGSSYTQKPLKFMSNVSLEGRKTREVRMGAYSYSGGGSYSYLYDIGNKYGEQTYQPSSSSSNPRILTEYNNDGTTLTYVYNSAGIVTSTTPGTWNQATPLDTLLRVPTPIAGQTATPTTPEYAAYRLRGAGLDRTGIMGGTESLWYGTDGATIATTKSDIPVTLIGRYSSSPYYGQNTGGNIWHLYTGIGSSPMYSYNYIQGTPTTYEGGSYQGSMGGIELPSTASGERDLMGRIRALYIDPAGNAGYLEGLLTGKAYPGINMYEMDGALTRTQVETAAGMGVTAASDLAYQWGSLSNLKYKGIFKDGATAVGAVDAYYFRTANSLTLFNTNSNVSVNWGQYSLSLGGIYDTAAANWEAKMGGQGSFGAYRRPGDPNITPSSGYWLVDITDGALTSGRLTATTGGRFLSQTLLGEINGNFGGTYDATTKTWEATSGGKWSGTPVAYSGQMTWGKFGYINTSGGSWWDGSSNIGGIVGGTKSLWSNLPSVAIGQYSNPNSQPIWDIDIDGKTVDGGAFYMSGGGTVINNVIRGATAGLYIKPDGQGGYLAGYLSANPFNFTTVYPEISMWEAAPTITTMSGVSTTTTPSELYWGSPKVRSGWVNGWTTGSLSGYTNTEILSLIDQNWGRWMSWSGGSYTTPSSGNWSARTGGSGNIGAYLRTDSSYGDDYGYWLADITNGSAADNILTGTVKGRFITLSKMGDAYATSGNLQGTGITGDLIGMYTSVPSPPNTIWQAVGLGKWSGTPLKFGNGFNSSRQDGLLTATSGSYYNYSDGSNFWYNYNNDYTWGQKTFRSTSGTLPFTSTYYNSNGTTRTDTYDGLGNLLTTTGRWDNTIPSNLVALVNAPQNPCVSPCTFQPGTYSYFNSIGSLSGNMGGTESLWYDGTTINLTKSKVPVTVIGQYSGGVPVGHGVSPGNLWYSAYFSERGIATYDGGRYRGIMGGVEVPSSAGTTRDLEGKVVALYIDPAGNAGYLKGNLAGKAYPGSGMFEMDGPLNRSQIATAAETGVSAASLTASTYGAWINADNGVSGTFTDGTSDYGTITASSYPANNTLSIYNEASNLFQGWGIYGLGFSGTYTTTPMPAWEAKMGGMGGFGVGEIMNNYIFADDGYWLADVNGSWADGKLTGAVTGKFMTKRKMGDINGDLLGVYNTTNSTWQAISLGTWTGTKLAFSGESGYNSSFWQYQYSGLASDSLTTSGALTNGSGWTQGLIGGTNTLFGTYNSTLGTYPAVTLVGLGSSGNTQGLDLFLIRFDGNDVKDTTLVNDYKLLFGGAKSGTSLAGGMQGLYWKKNPATGNYEIGVLSGNNGVTANRYHLSNNNMWELNAGTTLQAYSIFTGLPLGADPVIVEYPNPTSWSVPGSPTLVTEIASGMVGGDWKTLISSWKRMEIDNNLSIRAEVTGGGYKTGVPPEKGTKFSEFTEQGTRNTVTEITGVDSNNVFDAKVVTARTLWVDGVTRVGGGVIKGSFDPNKATWRAISLVTEMETAAFMNKISSLTTDAQRSAFYDATKIPCFTVGSATLNQINPSTEVNGLTNVSMSNVAFFANSTGGAPRIWATNAVTGNYNQTTLPVAGGTAATLSGGGLTATFGIQNWNSLTGKWGASVTGTAPIGSITGNTQGPTGGVSGNTAPYNFRGGAAGSINTPAAGTFSGTAAGIVK